MGQDCLSLSYSARIEINGYEIILFSGQRDEDCKPFYGIKFDDEQNRLFIDSIKELISYLEHTKPDNTNIGV
jgi:hypothetical protein